MVPLTSGQTYAPNSSDTTEQPNRTRQRRRLRMGGTLLIMAGVASLLMLVAGFSSMDAQNGEVMYFEVWLPPWFLLGEIMLFTSMATVSIVTGVTVRGGNSPRSEAIGAICSLVGFGFMFGLPALILLVRARRSV